MKIHIKKSIKQKINNTLPYFVLAFLWHILRADKEKAGYDVINIRYHLFKCSIFCFEKELFMAALFPKKIIDRTIELFNPKSILDLGCGIGRSLDYFISMGIDAVGVEGSDLAIRKAANSKAILRYNLNSELDLNKRFDLIWSFEFVEHIHPKYLDNLLKTFSNHSDNIVMSAARPDQGGDGHLNLQPETYWIKQFENYGYRLNGHKTEELRNIDEQFAQNMMVFER